jgi:membrane protease YdiL (CAAX protease family)
MAVILQILGLVGSSHLLEQLARLLSGFESSQLARRISGEASGVTTDAGLDLADPVVSALLVTALGSAVVEELLFRGLLFEGLRRWRGRGTAVCVSAVLFGAAHLDVHHGVVAVILGLQLGVLRQLHGLPIAIAAHVVNNGLWLGVVVAGHHDPIARFLPSPLSLLLAALLAGSACAALAQSWRHPEAA